MSVCIARWLNADSSTGSISNQINRLGGVQLKRFSMQMRSFRLPDSSALIASENGVAAPGRNLIVFRSSEKAEGIAFVEDPRAPLRRDQHRHTQGMGEMSSPHTRWTTLILAAPLLSTISPSSPSFPFDQLLSRVLCGAAPSVGAWQQRSSSIIIDGFNFVMDGFAIRVGGIALRGSATTASPKGIIIEVTILLFAQVASTHIVLQFILGSLSPHPFPPSHITILAGLRSRTLAPISDARH